MAVAHESQTLKHVIDGNGNCAKNEINVPNVNSHILSKVMEYCKKHDEADNNNGSKALEDALNCWDAEFINVNQATLLGLILAADHLNIKSLLDLTCQTVADRIRGKTPEDIRRIFNIKNDFTAALDDEIRRENQWDSE